MSLCWFSLISLEMFQTINRFWCQFVGQVIKKMILNTKKCQSCNSWDFQGNEKKNVISISVAPCVETLIRN